VHRSVQSGGFGRGGNDFMHVKMTFHGQFSRSFIAFIEDKAAQLSISVTVTLNAAQATVEAQGCSALIGALEMAACIDPDDCRVDSWELD